MKIGLDFDNTIVCYDPIFHKVALEQKLIPADTPVNKVAVRDHLRAVGNEDAWTEMQGYVYGARMSDVEPFADVLNVLKWAKATGHETFIVSHKTQHPFMGPKYDLHAAAREWILKFLVDGEDYLVAPENINFRETKSEKVDRVAELKCDVFVDDLPEILMAPNFPSFAQAILFDPEDNHEAGDAMTKVTSWQGLQNLLAS